MDLGDAGLVLPGPEKGHLEPARLGVEAQDEIMTARFRLYLGSKKMTEDLPPVGARPGRLGLAVVIDVKAAEQLQSGGGHMPAGAGKRVGAVAQVAGGFLVQGQGELGAVYLEVFFLNAAFHFPVGRPLFKGDLLHPALAEQISGGIDNIFGPGVVNELLQNLLDQTFVHAFLPKTARNAVRPCRAVPPGSKKGET